MSNLIPTIHFTNPRWWVFSRIIAAVFGGYLVASVSTLFIGQLLFSSSGKYQAFHTGLMLSFLIYACAAMWVFSVATAKSAWFGLLATSGVLAIVTWLLMQVNS